MRQRSWLESFKSHELQIQSLRRNKSCGRCSMQAGTKQFDQFDNYPFVPLNRLEDYNVPLMSFKQTYVLVSALTSMLSF